MKPNQNLEKSFKKKNKETVKAFGNLLQVMTQETQITSQGGPIPHNMARPLMVRQPYSEAVPSTGGRLHPLVPEVSVPRKRGNRRGCKDH